MMFCGLMSRWTIFLRWMKLSALTVEGLVRVLKCRFYMLLWAITGAVQYTKIMYRPDVCTVPT